MQNHDHDKTPQAHASHSRPLRESGNPLLDRARASASHYRRRRHLPPLLALWPNELADFSPDGTKMIIRRLEKSLAAERRRGRSGHWAYDLNRHMALISALEAERQYLANILRPSQ